MKQKFFTFIGLSLFSILGIFGQDVQISGTVTSMSDGLPLPGVNIIVAGTSTGSQTDFDGKYSISAPQGAVLQFSYLGMRAVERTVGSETVINVQLEEDADQLSEVVVTALGIKKSRKSLTYAAQDLKSDELTKVKDANPINSLSGKVSGLTVNRSSSGLGGSVKVTLRGNSSTRTNQPLYVIDGIPLSNNSSYQPNNAFGDFGGGNRDGGDALSLLNPDDIESMTVLKGASASALYGSQGANGVILITTKKGKEGSFKVTYSSNLTFENAASLPEFQTEYLGAAGENNAWNGGKGASDDHVEDFFNTGVTAINSVSISGGTEKAQTYFSYANTSGSGITPSHKLKRHSLNFRETAKLFDDRLTANANITLSTQSIDNKPVNGLYFNPLTGLYLYPRVGGDSFSNYENTYETFVPGNIHPQQNWIFQEDIQQNPYWIINRNQSDDLNQKLITALSLQFKVNDWLSFQTRGSYDRTINKFEKRLYATTEATLAPATGRFIYRETEDTQLYADLIATINKDFGEDWNLSANIGTSITNSKIGEGLNLDSGVNGGLRVPNQFIVQNFDSNFANSFTLAQTLAGKREQQSVFASTTLGFKEMIYLDLTARNDWTSTLSNTDNNSFFYPSVGITTILSEAFELPEAISYAKVRASYAEVGNDLPAFVSQPQFSAPFGQGAFIQSITSVVPLKPELQKSTEFGLEAKFIDNRLGFNATYYQTNTNDQIIPISTPTSGQGLTQTFINAGNIQNQGLEVSINASIIRNDNFEWNSILNYAVNDNKVKELRSELAPDQDEVILTDAVPSNINYRYIIKEGGSFGDIYAQTTERDANGNIVLAADGTPVNGGINLVGNANPDWTLGWNNSFEYKNITLNVLVDARFGGEVLSITEGYLDERGLSQRTADARNAGAVAGSFVNEDGTPFTGTVDPQAYYTAVGGRQGFTGEYVYDATNIRLAELSLGYRFKLPESLFIKSANFSVIGRNLFFFHKDAPFDPNISASTGEGLQGIDLFSQPTTRSLGFNLQLTF
ncbi:SusC/RagA family TonB-linked outer membrane protein [Aquimarina sp. TRL1]|uniref:SusC/RagA family TonB-linked outer membrane protein n=1 Tax=Aquimarina sp. (strain TRL1) TaxID=2736252 RepID=UPI00158E27C7|nr:SusC/RagA family TonB-linked outer membrane protein [Aquimarina sp. TRL1]QKX04348.1 SusC/RagA family TonB-linked outer membrane protein [Aquimarina sp. TRL1]